MDSLQLATEYLEPKLKGKYIHLDVIFPLLESFKNVFEITEIGKSVQQRQIHQVKIGTGKTYIAFQTTGEVSDLAKKYNPGEAIDWTKKVKFFIKKLNI